MIRAGSEEFCRGLAADLVERRERVNRIMKEAGVSALLFDRGANAFEGWLFGYGGRVLYIPGQNPKAISGGYIPEGRSEPVTHWMPRPDGIDLLSGLSAEELREAAGTGKKIGTMYPDQMHASLARFLAENVPEIEIVDMTRILNMERSRLSAFETDLMEDAARRHDLLFGAIPAMLVEGVYERDLVQQIRYTASAVSDGDCGEFYHTLLDVFSGREGQWDEDEPLKYPGRMLSYGDLVQIKAQAAIAGGYYGVLGRCFSIGEPSAETLAAWDVSVKAEDAAAALLVPGSSIRDAVNAGRAVIADAGYETPEMCNIYGIGNDYCIFPAAGAPEEDWPLEEGTVLAVGFPAAKASGSFPAACWDAFRVQPGGAKRLSRADRTIRSV